MLPATLDYLAPESIEEAVTALSASADARFVAGSYKLIIDLKMRRTSVSTLVDLRKLKELYGIAATASGIEIGAMASLRAISEDPTIQEQYAALAEAASQTGDAQIRSMAALGGILSYEASTSEIAAPLLALNATVHTHGRNGQRAIAAPDFFLPDGKTGLAQGEIITMVSLPTPTGASTYEKYTNPATLGAIIGVAVVTGETPTLGISGTVGQALQISGSDVSSAEIDWLDDLHVSAEYRAFRLGLMVERALARL